MNQKENKYQEAFDRFESYASLDEVTQRVQQIVEEDFLQNNNKEVLKFLYNTIDLTTLTGCDTDESVAKMVMSVNDRDDDAEMPNVAAICVYPALVPVVKDTLTTGEVRIACVSGGFPASQTFQEIKVAETALSVQAGADEIDIVLNLNRFLSGDYESCSDEIEEQKSACGDAHLKVILESGALNDPEAIRRASILSLYSGADFIKTSTGKDYPGASLEAAYVMCSVIKRYEELTGERRGIKFSGGIRTAEEAVQYFCVVNRVLGKEWLTNDLFRIGASSLEKNLREKIVK